VEEPHENPFWKVAHQPHKNSQIGFEANYVPPGHYNTKVAAGSKAISKPKYAKWSPSGHQNANVGKASD
jgi:hypothetical protein